jgi:hypothetical protein
VWHWVYRIQMGVWIKKKLMYPFPLFHSLEKKKKKFDENDNLFPSIIIDFPCNLFNVR